MGKTYPIYIETNLFSKLPGIFKENYSGKKIALVSDSNVFPLYGEKFRSELIKAGFDVVPAVFEAGENQKNFSTLNYLYSILADNFLHAVI